MNSQLSERMKKNCASFSKGQRLIAKYIEEHPDEVAFMTASKLGATVGVSESTVVRFATEIGYSGYPTLQQAIQEMIRSKLTSVQRLEMTYRQIPKEKLLSTIFEQDISTLKQTRESMDQEEFKEIVAELSKSKKVYIVGTGSALALGTLMAHYFELIFETVHLIEATSEAQIFQHMIGISEDDAVIGISFPRYSKRVSKALQFASDKGATTIAITDSEISPLVKHARSSLFARSDMISFVDSLVGPLSMINALIVMVAIARKDEVKETLRKIEDIWDEYGVYEKVDEDAGGEVIAGSV